MAELPGTKRLLRLRVDRRQKRRLQFEVEQSIPVESPEIPSGPSEMRLTLTTMRLTLTVPEPL